MTNKFSLDQPYHYCIRVQGKLGENWTSYFEDMQIITLTDTSSNPITLLTGELPDQAALQGVLQKLYNLGFPLISVEKVEPPRTDSISQ